MKKFLFISALSVLAVFTAVSEAPAAGKLQRQRKCKNEDDKRPPGSFVTRTRVQYAKISVTCGSNTYTLDTGNNSGECSVSTVGGSCDDGKGNSAALNCQDFPTNPCTVSSGSGSCTQN